MAVTHFSRVFKSKRETNVAQIFHVSQLVREIEKIFLRLLHALHAKKIQNGKHGWIQWNVKLQQLLLLLLLPYAENHGIKIHKIFHRYHTRT